MLTVLAYKGIGQGLEDLDKAYKLLTSCQIQAISEGIMLQLAGRIFIIDATPEAIRHEP